MAECRNVNGSPGEELELSVVIPCLNEASTVAACVATALQAMSSHGIVGEVVVSDNGSTDGSDQLATEAGARVVRCPVKGYGATLQYGFQAARGRYLLMADADGSYDFALIPQFVEKARSGASFVIGSRLRGRVDPGAMPLLNRYLGTPALTWVLNRLFGTAISDCNCGMRLLRRDVYFALAVTSAGMEFASEMVVKAAAQGAAIEELPIDFHPDGRNRPPHLRRWRDGWRHLRLLFWHAPDHLMTLPGLVMLLLGCALAVSQIRGPVSLEGAYLDIHYMILGVTLSLLGTSAVCTGSVVCSSAPPGSIRQLPLLAAARRPLTFDRLVLVALSLFLVGAVADGYVLQHWLQSNRGTLTPEHTRLTLLGLLLMATGVQAGLSALLLGVTRGALETATVRGAALRAHSASGLFPELSNE